MRLYLIFLLIDLLVLLAYPLVFLYGCARELFKLDHHKNK